MPIRTTTRSPPPNQQPSRAESMIGNKRSQKRGDSGQPASPGSKADALIVGSAEAHGDEVEPNILPRNAIRRSVGDVRVLGRKSFLGGQEYRMTTSLTAVSQHVSVGPFSTHYLTWGDSGRDPVVLLHDGAFGGSAAVSWSRMGPLLAQNYFVVAPDLLGFGDTDKAVFLGASPYQFRLAHIADLLEVIGITEPAHLVGTSFGGSLALRALAPDSPLGARSVTSINGTGGPWRTPLALTELGRWDGTRKDLSRIVRLLMSDGPHLSKHLDQRFDSACRPGHYRAIKAAASPVPDALRSANPVNDPWPEQVANTDIPVLLVAGSHDELLEHGWTGHLEAVLPNATVAILPGRHAPNVDDPDNLMRSLKTFLRQHDRAHTGVD
jgi:pimeloyl-ACP methyl ester carboxylesterase